MREYTHTYYMHKDVHTSTSTYLWYIYLFMYLFTYIFIYLWVSVASAKKPFPIESMFDSWFNSSAWLAWVNIMVPNSPRWTERSSSDWNNKTMLRIINYDSWTGCMILEQWSTQRLDSWLTAEANLPERSMSIWSSKQPQSLGAMDPCNGWEQAKTRDQ